MAGFLQGLFKDPEKDRKQLVELVANYSREVPELLPALREVVQYGILYDQKLKVFLDLLKQERRRQKRLPGSEGCETDHPENTEEVSINPAETEGSSPVKKKKKRKHKERNGSLTNETRDEILSEETVADQLILNPRTDSDHVDTTESVCFIEEGPPVKKKKNNKKEKSRNDGPRPSVDSQLPLNHGAGENSSYEDVQAKDEAKEEADETKNILINIVVGDQNGISCDPRSVSNTENTPRKSHASVPEAVTPFRVIPSVQLMEDPARFPDLVPSPPQPALPETASKPMKKWVVTFEFDSSVAQSGVLTAAEVCSALEGFGLKNIRVVHLEKSAVGSYFVKVEFFSPDFYRVFFDRQPSINGVTGRITESQVATDEPPSGESVDLCLRRTTAAFESTMACDDNNLRGQSKTTDEIKTESLPNDTSGGPQEEHSGIAGAQELQEQHSGEQCNLHSDHSTPLSTPSISWLSNSNPQSNGIPPEKSDYGELELIEQLLKSSTVTWVMNRACGHGPRSGERVLAFQRWLELQKNSVFQNSSIDADNVLFQPPRCWVKEFRKWFVQQIRQKAAGERTSARKSEASHIDPFYGAPSSTWLTPNPQASNPSGSSQQVPPHENPAVLCEPSTSSQVVDSSFGNAVSLGERPCPSNQSINQQQKKGAKRTSMTAKMKSGNAEMRRNTALIKLVKLLVKRENENRRASGSRPLKLWFLNNSQVQIAMNTYLPEPSKHEGFLKWMNREKSRLLSGSTLNKSSVLFSQPTRWFKAYKKHKKSARYPVVLPTGTAANE